MSKGACPTWLMAQAPAWPHMRDPCGFRQPAVLDQGTLVLGTASVGAAEWQILLLACIRIN